MLASRARRRSRSRPQLAGLARMFGNGDGDGNEEVQGRDQATLDVWQLVGESR